MNPVPGLRSLVSLYAAEASDLENVFSGRFTSVGNQNENSGG